MSDDARSDNALMHFKSRASRPNNAAEQFNRSRSHKQTVFEFNVGNTEMFDTAPARFTYVGTSLKPSSNNASQSRRNLHRFMRDN